MAVVGMDRRLTIPVTFAALTVAQLFHSIEEVVTGLHTRLPWVTAYLHDRFNFIPQLSVTRRQFAAANIAVVVFMAILSILLFRRIPWAVRIARASAFVEILNGIGHLVGMIVTRRYFPGTFSAIALIVCGVLFFRAEFIERALTRPDNS
jgi:hypothetical protein